MQSDGGAARQSRTSSGGSLTPRARLTATISVMTRTSPWPFTKWKDSATSQPDQSERRRTLHLNDDNSISVILMKNTSVHEYFHHAQGHARTRVGTGTLLIDLGAAKKWMTEGSAQWFEDDSV